MKIAAIQKSSLVDYPGAIAAVVFTPGCNLRCVFCHNQRLIDGDHVACGATQEEVIAWFETRRGLLDAVVISGGEPTLQPDLGEFVERVRAMGYLMKLDTNGTNPTLLGTLMRAELLDYVAMDVKAPPKKYSAICGGPVEMGAIEESVDILMQGSTDYEFRTTVVSQLTPEDILAIGRRVRGAQRYVLQQCRELRSDGLPGSPRWTSAGHPPWLDDMRQRLIPMVKSCLTRGFKGNVDASA